MRGVGLSDDAFTEPSGALLLLFVLEDVVHAGKSLDFYTRNLPSPLDDPSEDLSSLAASSLISSSISSGK